MTDVVVARPYPRNAYSKDAATGRRARAIEENIFSLGEVTNPVVAEGALEGAETRTCVALTQAQTFLTDAKQIGLLTLYESRINRTLQRNMTELNRLQTERKAEHARQLEEAALLAQLAESKCQRYDPKDDGFGFSTPEIARYIDRQRRLREAKRLAAQPTRFNPKEDALKKVA